MTAYTTKNFVIDLVQTYMNGNEAYEIYRRDTQEIIGRVNFSEEFKGWKGDDHALITLNTGEELNMSLPEAYKYLERITS